MPEKFLKPYDAQSTEGPIYKKWEESGYFNPDKLPGERTEPFTIIMPPPNANGSLHAGHALFVTIQDIMIRYQRMRGKKALWLPGADHAGFETQVVYERQLEKEGRSRFDMQPEDLYKEIMDFTLANKSFMEGQIRQLGASCDWSREMFTLDDRVIKTVYDTFQKLHGDGLLYRGSRIVNWCPKHQTSLSNLETERETRTDNFYYLKYGPFTIATARPETKFGDKYVVMHPDDPRYVQYKAGDTFELEWINGPITATVVKDKAIDMELGTGVMTITPWHDQADFDIAQRHNLPFDQVIDWRGKLLPVAGEFAGMNIKDARAKIVEKLQTKGLVEKIDDKYTHEVPVCYKCSREIEPQVRPQWFVKMQPLAQRAIAAIKDGEVKILTEQHEKIVLNWLENIQDWNISRQIIWGIPIPAWFKTSIGSEMEAVHFKGDDLCKKLGVSNENEFDRYSQKLLAESDGENTNIQWKSQRNGIIELYIGYVHFLIKKGVLDEDWIKQNRIERQQQPSEIYVGENPPEPIGWVRDPDTFDTWFSSGQWPFATLQFPDHSDFKTYYPTDVMETGADIIFFWVARMLMLGLYRTGHVPFKYVYLHGMVRDAKGQKMSKSKGNVISPIEVSTQYGTDALRMGLVVGNTPGTDMNLDPKKIEAYKKFANKLWNITRLLLENGVGDTTPTAHGALAEEFDTLAKDVTREMEQFHFHLAAEKLYHYVWDRFASEILEESKSLLKGENSAEKEARKQELHYILCGVLTLLHPFMPFVTEEIWGALPRNTQTLLMVKPWPVK